MIPLSDADRRPLSVPVATITIILVNAAAFLLELLGGDALIARWALVPAQVAAGQRLVTVFTSMFMHAGWLHIIGNMVFLWAFGPEVEDVMGPLPYLLFYLLGGIAATAAQVAVAPESNVPSLGASGAIAAVMGTFLITFPRDRIRTLLLIGWFVSVPRIPALVLVGLWFLIQLFSQVGAMATTNSGGGVAYMAHIGGFAFGAICGRWFESRRRRRAQGLRE